MDTQQMQLVDVKLIHPDPDQPRKHFPKESLEELATSLKTQGQLQPMLVKTANKGFKLIAGERRWRALQLAGIEKAKIIVDDESDERKVVMDQLAENLEREDLAPLEVGAGYTRLRDLGMSVEEICERFKKKKSSVYAYCKLHKLPKRVKEMLVNGRLITAVAMRLTRIPESRIEEALDEVANEYDPPMSEEDAARALEYYNLDVFKAPFDIQDAQLCPKAGACFAAGKPVCPKTLGDKKSLQCLDPVCWEEKAAANKEALKRRAKAEDMKVVEGAAASDLLRSSDSVGLGELDASVRKALGEARVAKTLALDDDVAVEVVNKAAARKVLEAEGLKVPAALKPTQSTPSGYSRPPRTKSASDTKRDFEHKVRNLAARMALAEFPKVKAVKDGGDAFIRALMVGFAGAIQQEPKKLLCKALCLPLEHAHEAEAVLLKYSERMKGAELRGFAMQLSVAEGLQIFHWGSGYDSGFEDAAKQLGMKLSKFETAARNELKAGKKKKPTPQKTAKPAAGKKAKR